MSYNVMVLLMILLAFGVSLVVFLFYKKISRLIYQQNSNTIRQIEALIQINQQANPAEILAYSRQWAASPDFILAIFQKIISHKPQQILELGSGLSSQYIVSLIANQKWDTQCLSIEHLESECQKMQDFLQGNQFTNQVIVQHAPLKKYSLDGQPYMWYDLSIDNLPMLDMLIVDGPPGKMQSHARYPAVVLLWEKLSPGALILVDDYHRPDEKWMVEQWCAKFPNLEIVEKLDTEKGSCLLRKKE